MLLVRHTVTLSNTLLDLSFLLSSPSSLSGWWWRVVSVVVFSYSDCNHCGCSGSCTTCVLPTHEYIIWTTLEYDCIHLHNPMYRRTFNRFCVDYELPSLQYDDLNWLSCWENIYSWLNQEFSSVISLPPWAAFLSRPRLYRHLIITPHPTWNNFSCGFRLCG